MMNMIRSRQALLVILIFSQFTGTSVWFATNAIVDSLPGVSPGNFATLTSSVQAGFIAGTLVFALFGVAVLNLSKKETKDTLRVYRVCLLNFE